MAVRPGREAGKTCGAADPTYGWLCTCEPGHIGNIHSDNDGHVWPIEGAEEPVKVPVDTEVQCPNCNLVFNSSDGRPPDTSKPPKTVRELIDG